MKVKHLEVFQDNDIQELKKLIEAQGDEIKDILLLRNSYNDCPLHLVCKNGYWEMASIVIKLHRKYRIDLDLYNNKRDTPLNLVCSHGMELLRMDKSLEDKKLIQIFQDSLEKRIVILKQLLGTGIQTACKANILNSLQKKKNTPLHWAIFYGDLEMGKLLFKEFPLMILKINENGHTPIELPFQIKLWKHVKAKSRELIHFILKIFILELYGRNEDFDIDIFKKSSTEERQFFMKLKEKYLKLNNIFIQAKGALQKLTQNINNLKQIGNIIDKKITHQTSQQSLINAFNQTTKSIKYEMKFQEVTEGAVIEIYDQKNKNNYQNPAIYLMHKLLMISVYVEDPGLIEVLINQFNISPFMKTMKNMSMIQYAVSKQHYTLVEYILKHKYNYLSGRKFNLVKELSKRGGLEMNSNLHVAALKNNIKLFDLLLKNGADITKYNYNDLTPLDINQELKFQVKREQIITQLENKDLLEIIKDPLKLDTLNLKAVQAIDNDFMFMIIAQDEEENTEDTLIYQQLKNLQKRFQHMANAFYHQEEDNEDTMDDNIVIEYSDPLQKEYNGVYHHYLFIQFKTRLLKGVASLKSYQIYNRKRGYTMSYSLKYQNQFDNLRDYHIHGIIDYIINEEFDLDHYKYNGIIIDAFPMHEFKTRQNIIDNWNKEKWSVFFDPWKLNLTKKDLRPFNSIAYYFGCEMALYVSFNVLVTSYMIILSICGLVIFLLPYIFSIDDDSIITPIYAVLATIWVTVVFEKWKRRQNVHSQIWNTKHSKINEIELKSYHGQYRIDSIESKVIKNNLFTTKQRRYITEVPLILSGIIIIIINFVLFVTFSEKVINLKDIDTVEYRGTFSHASWILILQAIIGTLNGIFIFIFTEIYKLLSNLVVGWENHKFLSDKENSFISKTFVFNFFISYINLFYYAFIQKDYENLKTNFFSIILSKNFLFLLQTNLIPYLIFTIKKKFLLKSWRKKRQKIKKQKIDSLLLNLILQNYNKKHKIQQDTEFKLEYNVKTLKFNLRNIFSNKKSELQISEQKENEMREHLEKFRNKKLKNEFKDLSTKIKEDILEIEKQLIYQDQAELTNIMPYSLSQIDLWMNNAIQFGYIAFFSIVLPISTLYGTIFNIINIALLQNSLTSFIKRGVAKERASIGVWKDIFYLMTMISIVSNISIILQNKKGIRSILNLLSKEETDKNEIQVMVSFEHIIFLIVFMLTKFISDTPNWLFKEQKVKNYRKRVQDEKQIENEMKQETKLVENQASALRIQSQLEMLARRESLDEDDFVDYKLVKQKSKNKISPQLQLYFNELKIFLLQQKYYQIIIEEERVIYIRQFAEDIRSFEQENKFE